MVLELFLETTVTLDMAMAAPTSLTTLQVYRPEFSDTGSLEFRVLVIVKIIHIGALPDLEAPIPGDMHIGHGHAREENTEHSLLAPEHGGGRAASG